MEQMKISILDGNLPMTEDGNAVLRSMQNSSTPILDLVVRESIQNSLDASIDEEKPVEVEFETRSFNSVDLNCYLERISSSLNKRFPEGTYPFLSIRDRGTIGLSGRLSKDLVNDNEELGNLIKLVYDINKAQDQSGKGGSWGIGKTIYFRLGIGLVIYYSNTINNQTNEIESRLAACMVEDQKSPSAILPSYRPNSRKSGIAWWGHLENGKTQTIPITDRDYIKDFLNIFGLKPYRNNETGTTIIVPYLKDSLLLDNIKQIESPDYGSTSNRMLNWHNSLDSYLRMAIQRWYCLRLFNNHYVYGSFLCAKVNGKAVTKVDMPPVFKYLQALYNRATNQIDDNYTDFITETNVPTGEEEISLNKIFDNGSRAGFLEWCKVSSEKLGMKPPHNHYSPYLYLDMDIKDSTKNRPIFTFCRKPAMAVSYLQDGDWLNGVPCTNPDEYILAVFALWSDARLRVDSEMSLDDYARAGERSDHINWEDHPVKEENLKIIHKIQNSVARKLSKQFTDKTNDSETRRISGLGQLLGRMILPPEGFGKSPLGTSTTETSGSTGTISGQTSGGGSTGGSTGGGTSGGNGPSPSKKRPMVATLIPQKTIFEADKVSYFYNVKTNVNCKGIKIDSMILVEGGNMSMSEWTDKYELAAPFEIDSISINTVRIGNQEIEKSFTSSKSLITLKSPEISINIQKTSSGFSCGADIIMTVQNAYEFELKVSLKIYSRDVKPQLNISNS